MTAISTALLLRYSPSQVRTLASLKQVSVPPDRRYVLPLWWLLTIHSTQKQINGAYPGIGVIAPDSQPS